ncbi:hypothetical protein [Francisella sp. SYW-9]|nr:hypothetical protein [Francisella sp. SYW-9]
MAYKRYPEEFIDQAVQLCLAEDANRKEERKPTELGLWFSS